MKTINLKRLELLNFKGIKNLTLDFNSNIENTIQGKNGIGKTTIFDAFTFLLYGKNSQNEKVFDIKTLDVNNNPINKLSHEVTGLFDVDGNELLLKVIYKEKWTKKRGSENDELTGHTTDYFINEVPATLSEYKLKIDSILEEENFKMLSNTLYFNQTLDWKKRRLVLSDLAGEINDTDVINILDSNKQSLLCELLSTEKSFEEYKKEYTAKRKKVKEELDQLPARIDEVKRSIPQQKDWNAIQKKIDSLQSDITKFDSLIENATKVTDEQIKDIQQIKSEKFYKEQKIEKLILDLNADAKQNQSDLKIKEQDLKHSLFLLNDKLTKSNQTLSSRKKQIQDNQNQILELEKQNDDLRNQFVIENKKEFDFDLDSCTCPTCKQGLPVAEIKSKKAKLLNNFTNNKTEILNRIRNNGKENIAIIEKFKAEIIDFETNITVITNEIDSIKTDIEARNNELKAIEDTLLSLIDVEIPLSDEIKALQKEVESIIIPELKEVDTSVYKQDKQTLLSEINDLQQELYEKKSIEEKTARLQELESQFSKLSQEIANFEKYEMAIESFNHAKIYLIEKRVNQNFELVTFKMFEEQLNGGISETCVSMVNGVPFNSLNTAMKINAGLDTIKTLSKFYETKAPIFIDNRESVTEIVENSNQIINLAVNKDCEVLKVN